MLYLSLLQVPEGYETEVITVEKAASMAAGYNEGMNASDAKYKIYLHQDVLVTEPLFLEKLLEIFHSDKEIGMIGMLGAECLSKDGVIWHEDICGDFYRLDKMTAAGLEGIEKVEQGIREVEAVYGFLMATQYDLSWREDIFKEWDFYEVSQCMEFRRKGYKIVIPAQNPSWVIHAGGIPNLCRNDVNRRIALKEYPEIGKNKKRLRILFIHSTDIQILGIAYSLMSLGHRVEIPDYKVTLGCLVERDIKKIEEKLEEGNYDLVVTYDYCIGVSEACKNMRVKYYSWIYDNPFLELYTNSAKSPYNYISVFDKKQYESMKAFGLKNLYYVPLCAEVEVFGSTDITKEDEKKYKTDVSFVGRLYNHRNYRGLFDKNSLELQEEFENVAGSCKCIWDGNTSVYGRASAELIDHIAGKLSDSYWEMYGIDKRYFCESMKIAGYCNEIERTQILNRLAERFQVTLYSDDQPKDKLRNVIIKPWVDYWAEMPKVFHLSKINLNITSRSIESGVPQRVWDIMAVGGFCLTNYQPELEDCFEVGKDLEVYHDLQELEEKTAYYLKHEKQRINIAMSGYQKVRKYHNYDARLRGVLELILGEEVNGTIHSNG